MNIIPFKYGAKDVRFIDEGGQHWILFADVCQATGHSNNRKAIKLVRQKDVTERYTPTPGGNQMMAYINESGLYQFLLRSRAPGAEQFRDWVTDEVLPSLRQNGTYSLASAAPTSPSLADLAQLVGIRTGEIESRVQQIAAQVELVPQQAAQAAIDALAALNSKKVELKQVVTAVVNAARKAPDHDRQARSLSNWSRVWRDCHGAAWPPVSSLADYTSSQQLDQAISRANAMLGLLGASPIPQQLEFEVMPPDAR